jgi:hypothetical protein
MRIFSGFIISFCSVVLSMYPSSVYGGSYSRSCKLDPTGYRNFTVVENTIIRSSRGLEYTMCDHRHGKSFKYKVDCIGKTFSALQNDGSYKNLGANGDGVLLTNCNRYFF